MIRNFLTGIALLAALSVSVAAGVEVIRQAVKGPVPVIIDGVNIAGDDFERGVLHTLLEYEFARSKDRSQKRFVLEMLEDRLDEGADIVGEWKTLSRSERLQVQQNVLHLAPVWLQDHADEYFALLDYQKPAYLDQQIAQLWTWAQASSPIGADREGLMEGIDPQQIQAELYDWMNGINFEDRQQYLKFLRALRDRATRKRQW